MLSDSLMVEGVSDSLEITNHRCDHNINPSVENGGVQAKTHLYKRFEASVFVQLF